MNAVVAQCHAVDLLRISFQLKRNTGPRVRKGQGRSKVSIHGSKILQLINLCCVYVHSVSSVTSEMRQLASLFQVEAGLTASMRSNLIHLRSPRAWPIAEVEFGRHLGEESRLARYLEKTFAQRYPSCECRRFNSKLFLGFEIACNGGH